MFMPPGITFLRGVDRLLAWLPLGAQYVVAARKRRVNGKGMGMDRQTFEAGLKRDGYEILTNTTPGAKMNPEHSHPFDVRAMVLKGAITITSASEAKTYKPGDTWDLARGCLHSESYGPEGAVVLFGRKT